MCRIESPALKAIESSNAAERINQAENRLVYIAERYANQVLKRRGSKRVIEFTKEQREKYKAGLRQRVAIAREI